MAYNPFQSYYESVQVPVKKDTTPKTPQDIVPKPQPIVIKVPTNNTGGGKKKKLKPNTTQPVSSEPAKNYSPYVPPEKPKTSPNYSPAPQPSNLELFRRSQQYSVPLPNSSSVSPTGTRTTTTYTTSSQDLSGNYVPTQPKAGQTTQQREPEGVFMPSVAKQPENKQRTPSGALYSLSGRESVQQPEDVLGKAGALKVKYKQFLSAQESGGNANPEKVILVSALAGGIKAVADFSAIDITTGKPRIPLTNLARGQYELITNPVGTTKTFIEGGASSLGETVGGVLAYGGIFKGIGKTAKAVTPFVDKAKLEVEAYRLNKFSEKVAKSYPTEAGYDFVKQQKDILNRIPIDTTTNKAQFTNEFQTVLKPQSSAVRTVRSILNEQAGKQKTAFSIQEAIRKTENIPEPTKIYNPSENVRLIVNGKEIPMIEKYYQYTLKDINKALESNNPPVEQLYKTTTKTSTKAGVPETKISLVGRKISADAEQVFQEFGKQFRKTKENNPLNSVLGRPKKLSYNVEYETGQVNTGFKLSDYPFIVVPKVGERQSPATTFSQAVNVKSVQGTASVTKSNLKPVPPRTIPIQELSPAVTTIQETTPVVTVKSKSATVQETVTMTPSVVVPVQQRTQERGSIFKPYSPPKIEKPKSFTVPKIPKQDDRKLPSSRFTALVRRRGKFVSLGSFESKEKAFASGLSKVRNTASASFKIESSLGGDVSADFLPEDITLSKRSRNIFVQKRGRRISSRGEKTEIRPKRRGVFAL